MFLNIQIVYVSIKYNKKLLIYNKDLIYSLNYSGRTTNLDSEYFKNMVLVKKKVQSNTSDAI